MVEKHTCKRCGRSFNSPKALKQHTRSKHFSYYFALNIAPPIGIAALLIIVSVIFIPPYLESLAQQATQQTPEEITERFLTGHEGLAMHDHVTLRVFVDGNEVEVPRFMGLMPDGRLRYIHTHSTPNRIHIESPIVYDFKLEDIFKVWGKRFDENCFDTYCGDLKVLVNGEEISDPVNYVLKNEDEIVVEVRTS